LNTTTQLYDLDFRNYDPLLGRMNGVDPMASKYSSLTPYNYSFNDPVTFTDVNGADPNSGCTQCEPIYQPYTGFQYSNSYGGFIQDDVIYYRQNG
jgi:RHS repeat-associated protein